MVLKSVLERITALDRKFAWSFLGFVLAVFFGGLTIHNEFIRNPNPALIVQILSDTNVLDVRENVPELKIVYGDVDIRSLNQTLSVVVFRVQNTGGAAILNSFYEDKAIPTISLNGGKFIKVEQLSATSAYLAEAAQPVLVGVASLQLPKVILEPGESYTIKALLLHGPRSGIPFRASGKVAGMKEISVLLPDSANKQESFWTRAFSGGIPTQLLRAPAYFVGFILLIFVVFSPIAYVVDKVVDLRRLRIVNQFRKHHRLEVGEGEERVIEVYLKQGLGMLVSTREMLGDPVRLKAALEDHKSQRGGGNHGEYENIKPLPEYAELNRAISDREITPFSLLERMGAVSIREDGEPQVNKASEAFLSRFIDFVSIKQS